MNNARKPDSDIVAKRKIILIVALFSLFGYILEMGPIAHAWQLTILGFGYTLPVLGFLPYFSLAMSAAIGLRINEYEYRRDDDKEVKNFKISPEGEMIKEKCAVRPDLHQLRMIIAALGGYAILRAISNYCLSEMYPGIYLESLFNGFKFGFFYIILSWFILWHFMRWYAMLRKWRRLTQELVGADSNKFFAIIIFGILLFSCFKNYIDGISFNMTDMLNIAILISFAGIAYFIWHSRPYNLRKTVVNIGWVALLITVLTILLVPAERYLIR